METLRIITTALVFSVMIGCTIVDGGSIVTGVQREQISVEEVRIYRVPPENYEEIAIVSASAGHDFRSNSDLMDSAIQRLKEEAAKVGANGVLLMEIDERDAPSTTTTHGSVTAIGTGGSVYASGNSVSVNRGDSYSRIRGLAIHVP